MSFADNVTDEQVDLINVSMKLEGLYRRISHAAGLVIGDRP